MRVMKDTTVETTARKLFKACGASWTSDQFYNRHHWDSVVRAWAAGATRSLTDEDRHAIVDRLESIDYFWMADERGVDYDPPEQDVA